MYPKCTYIHKAHDSLYVFLFSEETRVNKYF